MRERRLKNEINVVPYIDVMLVLLIMFIITIPIQKEGMEMPAMERLMTDLLKIDRG